MMQRPVYDPLGATRSSSGQRAIQLQNAPITGMGTRKPGGSTPISTLPPFRASTQPFTPTPSNVNKPAVTKTAEAPVRTTLQQASLDRLVQQDAIAQARQAFMTPGSSPNVQGATKILKDAAVPNYGNLLSQWENEWFSPPALYGSSL